TSTPWMTSVAPKAFRTSRIAPDAMDAPLFGRLQTRAAALCFRPSWRRHGRTNPGRQLDGIIGAISIPCLSRVFSVLQLETPVSCGAVVGQSDDCAPCGWTEYVA